MSEQRVGNFEAIPEKGSDNFATSIYEVDYDGLLIARCNQNGRYPHQVTAILNGLNGKQVSAELIAEQVAEIERLRAALASPDRQMAIPEGWQLVPKLATLEMEKAAVARVKPYHDEDWYRVMPKDLFRLAWKALLSASPPPPPAATGGEVTPQMIEAFRAARDAASEWCGCYDPGQHRHYITTGRDEVWSLVSEDYVTGHFAMMEELDRIRIKHALSAALSAPKQEGNEG